MCLAVPAKIIKLLANERALVDLAGVQKEISLSLVDDIQIGNYVVVHVGYALQVLDEDEAKATLKLFEDKGLLEYPPGDDSLR